MLPKGCWRLDMGEARRRQAAEPAVTELPAELILYHYTGHEYVERIRAQGLTRGELPLSATR